MKTTLCWSQDNPPEPLTNKEWKTEERNHQCIHTKKFSVIQRLSKFPFTQASQVKLVSFYIKSLNDSNAFNLRLPIRDGNVDYSIFKEVRTLNKQQINSLTDILYNTGYRGATHVDFISLCQYMPRNAILFIDSSDKIFAFIELCFSCDRVKASSESIEVGDFCNQKYALLKNFFSANGIRYGISKTEHQK